MLKSASVIIYCLAMFGLISCTKDVYKQPVTIDRMEFKNLAGIEYEQKFQKVNEWQLLLLDSMQALKPTLLIDTKAKKRYHKWNHTLVASLERLDVTEGQPGLYYQFYLRPNSGIGKLKGGVQHDMYNHLKLYTPESNFYRHEFKYYKDSTVVGSFANLMPAHELLKPNNLELPDMVSFSIDKIDFSSGFKKKQRNSMMRIINNAFVVRQPHNLNTKSAKRGAFNFYPNFITDTDHPATYALQFNVTDNAEANEIVIEMHYEGGTNTGWKPAPLILNRQDFLNGHYYEAAYKVKNMISFSVSRLQFPNSVIK